MVWLNNFLKNVLGEIELCLTRTDWCLTLRELCLVAKGLAILGNFGVP